VNEQRIFQVLLAPHISEKAALLGDASNQHVFKVATDAKKGEIKAAVEQLFNVKVSDVRTLNQNGKAKRMGQRLGHRNNWKKAYVSLEQGHEIDLASIGA
jgi:large subunit ribosomal protein L23